MQGGIVRRWWSVTVAITLLLCLLLVLLFPHLPTGITLLCGLGCAAVGMLAAEFDQERRDERR